MTPNVFFSWPFVEDALRRHRFRKRLGPQRHHNIILRLVRFFSWQVHKHPDRNRIIFRPVGLSYALPYPGAKGWHFHLLGIRLSGHPGHTLIVSLWKSVCVSIVRSAGTVGDAPGIYIDIGRKAYGRYRA